MKATCQLLVSSLLVAMLVSCAKERPLKRVAQDLLRIPKSQIQGTYLYLRTVVDSKYTAQSANFLPSGLHVSSDSLVQFIVKKDVLEVTAIDPLYNAQATAKHSGVLLSFPVKHVDILKKQNDDGTETHQEEQTESRRPWQEREHLIIDITQNLVDLQEFQALKSSVALSGIQTNPSTGYLDFLVEKTLADSSVVVERFSFLKFDPSSTYEQRPYPRKLQQRFGIFKTTTYQFDRYGQALQSLLVEVMNRRDTSKKVVYYLSPNFPEHLKPVTYQVFHAWNQAFVKATGREVLELRENSGQEIGDLRYTMVIYNDSDEANGLLGYGPSVVNPRTGEIIKADVLLYGGSLKRSIVRERDWLSAATDPGIGTHVSQRPASAGLPARLTRLLADPRFSNISSIVRGPDPLVSRALEAVWSKDGKFSSKALFDRARSSALQSRAQYTTQITQDTLSLVSDLTAQNQSDEQIEVKIFGPLLAHELGHTLGLRHNFMASADHKHTAGEGKGSSVMDYSFLSVEQSLSPGPYDVAAIEVAYGNTNSEIVQDHLDANFLYCTDENVFDTRSGLCHRFDSGATLYDIVKNQIARYFKGHRFINRRNDRVSFPGYDDYINRIFAALLPVRVVYDYAHAIAKSGSAYLEGSSQSPSDQDDRVLWSLLRQRVEADKGSRNVKTLRVSPTRQVRLDVDKLLEAVKDAVQARLLAFTELKRVVTDNDPTRPDRDGADWEFNDLTVRGVLSDKLYALLFLMMPTADPAAGGGAVCVFDTFHEPMSELLGDLVSNTVIASEGLVIGANDLSLRYVALDFMEEFSYGASNSGGELLELLRLDRVAGQPMAAAHDERVISELVNKLETLRKGLGQAQIELQMTPSPEVQSRVDELHKQVTEAHSELVRMQLRSSAGERDVDLDRIVLNSQLRAEMIELAIDMEITGPTEEGQQKLGELIQQLSENNIAHIGVTDARVLKAPLRVDTFGGLETASGRLLFYNLNLIEDRVQIIRGVITALDLAITVSAEESEKAELEAIKAQLTGQLLELERYIASEKRFVQRVYDVYR